jgi:peptide-methionine (S)-S-oxide reductase
MNIDQLFRRAVALIGAGDVPALDRLLNDHPELARERLAAPGPWLRDKIGGALDGFFEGPYLLWFVSEDAPVHGRLPKNIADVTRAIIRAVRRNGVPSLQEQLDYALRLVAWSGVAHKCGVQIELLDVLLGAGASPDGASDGALVNGHVAAAEHLVGRGAKLTLAAALCLGRWDDVSRLAAAASDPEKRMGFVLAALNGKADALRRMIDLGADVNAPSEDLYAHGTPLHHAVCSGSLDAVKVLVAAGANPSTRDTAWRGTPLGWAEHYLAERKDDDSQRRYGAIADYFREHHAHSPA